MDGPVVIPGLYDGRNKTFFMGAYEGIRSEGLSSPIVSVPTALMRQGNFSEVTNVPSGTPSRDSRFPATSFRPAMLSPTALKLLDYFPAPNRPGIADNLQAQAATTDDVDQVLTRVDQNLGNKVRLSVRYNWHDTYPSAARRFPSRASRSRA